MSNLSFLIKNSTELQLLKKILITSTSYTDEKEFSTSTETIKTLRLII
jgi:hypothetical protein